MHLIRSMFKRDLTCINKIKYSVLWLQSNISVHNLLYWEVKRTINRTDDDSLLNQTDCTFSLRNTVMWSHGHMDVSKLKISFKRNSALGAEYKLVPCHTWY